MRKSLTRLGWLLAVLWLSACADTSPTVPVTTPPTEVSAGIRPTEPVPTTMAVRTTEPSPPTEPVSTTMAVRTTEPGVTPEPTPSLGLPTATPGPPPFEPGSKAVGPAKCCQDFSFSGDGRLVFYDKPAGESRAGTYALEPSGGQPTFLTAGIGLFSPDLSLAALSNRTALNTTIEDLASGRRLARLYFRPIKPR